MPCRMRGSAARLLCRRAALPLILQGLADGTCGTEGGTEHQQLNCPPLECGLLVV